MIKSILCLFMLLLICAVTKAAPATMRLDYFHTGDAKHEVFSMDRVVIEPLPWPGDLTKTIDDTNLGKYFFEVRDQKTNRVLYSRGFASVYGEWETTDEAQKIMRSFSESLRFPAPDTAVNVVLKKRDKKNKWVDIWTTTIDPKDMFVDHSKPRAPAPLIPIQKMGDPATKVDLLLLGDGYTAREIGKFQAVDNAFANYVFVHEFGHHFAGLADEYYTSPVAYGPAPAERVEPWEPNATALLDKNKLKWKDLIAPDTPIPTSWNKEEFEAYEREYGARRAQLRKENRPESEMEALFREDRHRVDAMMGNEKYAGRVGAFEGAMYEAKGYYRPQVDCIMFSRTNYFCKVCSRAIERVVSLYARH